MMRRANEPKHNRASRGSRVEVMIFDKNQQKAKQRQSGFRMGNRPKAQGQQECPLGAFLVFCTQEAFSSW